MVFAPALNHRNSIESTGHQSNGGRLVSTDGRELPLRRAALWTSAKGGVARVTLVQEFVNPHAEPLLVRYLLPLPADGAVSGFSFKVADQRVIGEVDKKHRARERFEQAIASGRTAAIIEEQRTSVFQQEVGNIPPGESVICEVIVDQRLTWLSEGAWEWRFPTVVGPRYMGQKGRVKDANRMTVDVAESGLAVRMELELAIEDAIFAGRNPESPSHALKSEQAGSTRYVSFGDAGGVRLDRDVVVRWPVAKPEVGVSLTAARPSAEVHEGSVYGLLTIVPPQLGARMTTVPRDLIVLIDTSGSMGGEPLRQAQRVVSALIDGLDDHDRLELIQFSSFPSRWQPEPVVATRDGKRAALNWVKGLRASGGTEMRAGVIEALRPLRPGAQRQVLLITDGYIGFEREIIETIVHQLPTGCRLHTLGVGSAVNRSLTGPAARAGGGVELVLGLGEDVERAAVRLLKRMNAPLVTELRLEGDLVEATVPAALPDVYAESPAMIAVMLKPEGGTLRVRGRTAEGSYLETVTVPRLALGEGMQCVTALFGREWVEDLETRLAAGGDRKEIDHQIEQIGLTFQIATRLTSWVAISEEALDAKGVLREEQMPHELPYGTSMEGLGLRSAGPAGPASVPRPSPMRARAKKAESSSLGRLMAQRPPARGEDEARSLDVRDAPTFSDVVSELEEGDSLEVFQDDASQVDRLASLDALEAASPASLAFGEDDSDLDERAVTRSGIAGPRYVPEAEAADDAFEAFDREVEALEDLSLDEAAAPPPPAARAPSPMRPASPVEERSRALARRARPSLPPLGEARRTVRAPEPVQGEPPLPTQAALAKADSGQLPAARKKARLKIALVIIGVLLALAIALGLWIGTGGSLGAKDDATKKSETIEIPVKGKGAKR